VRIGESVTVSPSEGFLHVWSREADYLNAAQRLGVQPRCAVVTRKGGGKR
jgi:hypothetical protein